MIPKLSCPVVTRTPPSLASSLAQVVDEQQADQYDKGGGVRIGDVVALRAAERPGALTSDGFVDLVLDPPPGLTARDGHQRPKKMCQACVSRPSDVQWDVSVGCQDERLAEAPGLYRGTSLIRTPPP